MKRTIKKYFIPHQENDYHPHILHSKRTVFYSALFLCMKVMLIAFVVSVPNIAFLSSERMDIEQEKLLELVSDLREELQVTQLSESEKLLQSSQLKAKDMASSQYFSHISPDGHDMTYFLEKVDYDYKAAGENLSMGYGGAEELFQAWKESPTHFENLIDTDFKQGHISMVHGFYNNVPTVYSALHLGTPKNYQPQEVEESATLDLPQPTNTTLTWEETDSGMRIDAIAHFSRYLKNAEIQVKKYKIVLEPDEQNKYTGSIEINEKPDKFFKTVLPGVLKASEKNETAFLGTVNWQAAKVVEPTTIEKYSIAKNTIPSLNRMFSYSQNIYFGFLVFFSIALALKIFIEIKKQHYKVISQTVFLLALLLVLIIW